MISFECDDPPANFMFDVSIVAVGYERRCRWVTQHCGARARVQVGLEFGFLTEGSYQENREFFEGRGFEVINGIAHKSSLSIATAIRSASAGGGPTTIFLDISSMSREMIANLVVGIEAARSDVEIYITVAYAPSAFAGPYAPAPIRFASPIKPALAGWSSQPEQPLGTIFGLGCEPGLALGALQFLEPDKAWVFSPRGVDANFDVARKKANAHIEDIFDVTVFDYDITKPTNTRGRFEALLNTLDSYFRLIAVPFGPKIFGWVAISTVVFTQRSAVGVWAFSSKDQAQLVDRDAEGSIVWHNMHLTSTRVRH